jgi:hypothetical protein
MLSQSIINSAIIDCQNRLTWGIDLPSIKVNYLNGISLVAAVVLHNGNDLDRLVTIKCSPQFETTTDSDTGDVYNASPLNISRWIIPQVSSVRMTKMQTEAISITLLVPDSVKLPDKWAVDIAVNGLPIVPYEQDMIVTSGDNDTTLVVHLDHSLLEGTKSVLSIKSEIDEQPYVTDYDSVTGILTIGGLLSNQKREIGITYEPIPTESTAYNQVWFITMIK